MALSGAAVVSALFLCRIVSIGNLSLLPSPLQQYTSEDQHLSLYYPSSWEYHFDNSTDDAGETTHTLTLYPKGDSQTFYSVMVNWGAYLQMADCASFAQEQIQQSLASHDAKITDPIGQSIRALFTPLQKTVIANYPACQFPVSTAYAKNIAYREEMYAILLKGEVFSISFPTADSPTTIILDPAKNNRIAHRILDSLQILDVPGVTVNMQYHFSITTPKGMSASEAQARAPELYRLDLRRPNANTNEGETRDTLNGFNTSSTDRAIFAVYAKPTSINVSDTAEFQKWFEKTVQPYRQLVHMELQTQRNRPVYVTSESDGVAGSTGRYEYLVGKQYIYMLGSDDLADQALEAILATVSVE